MKDFLCIVARNDRLAFQGADAVVEAFLRRRLTHAGCTRVRFVPQDGLDAALEQALDPRSRDAWDGYVLAASVMNPMLDLQLVRAMAWRLDRTGAGRCVCDGAVPGTQPLLVARAGAEQGGAQDGPVLLRWHSQRRHNNQFNLFKYKRLKMFLALETMIPDMHTLDVDGFVRELESEQVFAALAGFCTGARLVDHADCPHCGGLLDPLPRGMSQPFCGFLPASRPLYAECEACGLIVATPAVHEDDIPRLYDAFDTQDFVVTPNTPYRPDAPRCDFSAIAAFLPEDARTLDLGGGMGRFSLALKRAHPGWRVTHSDFEHKQGDELARAGVNARVIDLLSDAIGDRDHDLITAWEVVEHLPLHRFRGLLARVWEALAPGGFFVFSTPDFDSPLCRSLDFFAACPPFHQLVFRQSWLRRFFAGDDRWDYLEPRACSDFLDDAGGWYGYAAATCPSMAERATARMLDALFRQQGEQAAGALLSQGIGTEVIITLRKR